MRPTKLFFTASLAMTLIFCSTAFSADMDALRHTTALQRAKLQTALMKKRLNLTKSQSAQVMTINLKYAQQMEPVIKGDGGKLAKMRQSMAIRKAKDTELTRVLTPTQYQAYLASKEQMRQQMIEKIMQKRQRAG
ncbi:MAG: hypothetical protein P4L43_12330 [Syntrophobacteraceae bacterium]|nr:hypothetical protein [Syntrophobacteraceae bacterium]